MAATTTRMSRAREASWTSASSTGTVRAWRSASALATRSARPVSTTALGLLMRSSSATLPRAGGTAAVSARRSRSGWTKWSKRARMSRLPLSITGSRSAPARKTASSGGSSLPVRRGREVGGLGAEPVLVAGRRRVHAGDHQVAAGGAGPEPLDLEAVAGGEPEPVGGAAAEGRLGRQAERTGRRAAAGLQHQPGAEAVAAGQVRAARAPALGQQRDRGAGLQAGDRRGQRRHGRPGRGHRLGEVAQLLAVGHDLADVQAGGVAGGGAQVLGEQRLPGGAQVDGAGRAHPDREGGHGQQRRRQPGPGPQPAQGQPERAHWRSSCPREASYAPAVLMSRPPGPSRPAGPGPGS